ncbi:MAG TPA: nucleotidyltransferase domain-containing protein [Vicinamibacterales bacterium]|nr:nucleotidyltransferase domain-containing protein [Vicinamibacterales bacterium]
MIVGDTISDRISDFRTKLEAANQERPPDLILIGSVARGTNHDASDLDLLVISERPPVRVTPDPALHVQYFTEAEFLSRLNAGDDFAAWCVRFGVPLADTGLWSRVTSGYGDSWPNWHNKLPHASRRLHLAASMLQLGDIDAAGEESLYALTHVGRAILLQQEIFPLSRPEMVNQLADSGFTALSKLLQKCLFDAPDTRTTRLAIAYVKKLLVNMDREWYAANNEERRERRRQKALRIPAS